MLPQVDENVLRDNPDFAKLYRKLTTSILKPDGTTRDDPRSEERDSTRKQLDEHRLKAAKEHILSEALASVAPEMPSRKQTSSTKTSPQSHDSVIDILAILPLLLSTKNPVSSETAALLLSNPPMSELDSLLPTVSAMVSSHLQSTALDLTRITRPTANPAYLYRYIPSLPRDVSASRSKLADTETALVNSRLQAISSLTRLLQSYSDAAVQLMTCLETKHGPVAKSLELRASEIALLAQQTEAETTGAMRMLRKDLYSPEVISALSNYLGHLKDAKVRAAERVVNSKRELERYGVGTEDGGTKEKTMRELARLHGEIGQQVNEVTRDLERLQTS